MQHFLFCRRQWALIHIENQWDENLLTTDGAIMHARAHDETLSEKRGDIIITRAVKIFSRKLGISGQCDVLEYHAAAGGITLHGWKGSWLPFPVEYKHGEPKTGNCDAGQLCAQAMCLEEMLCCRIENGALYYGETRRRTPVEFTPELRNLVYTSLEEMHELFKRGRTPKVKPSKACNACSLKDLCVYSMGKTGSVKAYLDKYMREL